jgi:hypothetical protein
VTFGGVNLGDYADTLFDVAHIPFSIGGRAAIAGIPT